MEHSEEILDVKCLEYSSPSWARSVLSHDQAIKWAKAKVCVYADSVLCVGQMKDSPKPMERWRGQVEGFRDAAGIDGEAIEFEWKNSQDFHHCLFFTRDPQRLDEKEHSARRVQGPDHLHVNVQ